MRSAEFLLRNLPLDNIILTSLSALTPSLIQSDAVIGALTALGEALPNVVPPEEIGQLVDECRAYQMDVDMLLRVQSYIEEDCRVDVDWWSHVASLKNAERDVRYPILCKLVKALLSIFTGPLVEGSFNLMDDILEDDRCSMNVETYESLAMIKSTLKARDWTASTMTIDQPLRRSCLSSFQNYLLHLQKKKENEQALKQKRLSEAARIQSSKEANKLVQQARKVKRQAKSSSVPISTSSAQATTSSDWGNKPPAPDLREAAGLEDDVEQSEQSLLQLRIAALQHLGPDAVGSAGFPGFKVNSDLTVIRKWELWSDSECTNSGGVHVSDRIVDYTSSKS
ncbi:hypothetical protein SRHO_G00193960 [Serrasalmus rhombeus]